MQMKSSVVDTLIVIGFSLTTKQTMFQSSSTLLETIVTELNFNVFNIYVKMTLFGVMINEFFDLHISITELRMTI